MESFENIKFKGTFRTYQQKILDNADSFLNDGKINIVAAPGSGKTILGLELIRKLNAPCIVMSPTTTIREQWGSRFKEMFLENENDHDRYFSYDLNEITLINSITYQALYSAMSKVAVSSEDEVVDYSNIDLFKLIKENNVKTICLDEAHHLQNEWQKALEKFIKGLDEDVKVISLTATPPYDSTSIEWQRYVDTCGEIDDEIFVPELVNQNTLCPHQDYIYFNYPTKEEIDNFESYRLKATLTAREIGQKEYVKDILQRVYEFEKDYDFLFSHAGDFIALLTYFKWLGYEIKKKLIVTLTRKKKLPEFNLHYGEVAIQFILDSFLNEEQKEEVVSIFRKEGLYEKKKLALDLNDKLRKKLVSSLGKLASISSITKTEYESMGSDLRMLVLTDYIKKEAVSSIGSGEKLDNISVVSVFETIRGSVSAKIGILSGTLVVLPTEMANKLDDEFSYGGKYKLKEIRQTGYAVFDFKGSNKNKVDIVSKLFEKGYIQILVGTKSLLGEGWDSPCINSLILASFVGSFVSSNQMRGRAIRIDKTNPNKVSNIWHLATIEPNYIYEQNLKEKFVASLEKDNNTIVSYDYETLEKRFDCFVAPNYETGDIESGIERISIIKPPYTKKHILEINEKMVELSKNREEVAEKWKFDGEGNNGSLSLNLVNEVPIEKKVPVITYFNMLGLLLVMALDSSILTLIILTFVRSSSLYKNIPLMLLCIVLFIVFACFEQKFIRYLLRHFSPYNSFRHLGKAVLRTLKEAELIKTCCSLKVNTDESKVFISLVLVNATIYEQNIFNTAINELLTPIENPRYIIIKKNIFGKYNYGISFACPSIIGQKKEYVEIFKEQISDTMGKMQVFYTRNEDGRALILKCRKRSFISKNTKKINKKQKFTNWD